MTIVIEKEFILMAIVIEKESVTCRLVSSSLGYSNRYITVLNPAVFTHHRGDRGMDAHWFPPELHVGEFYCGLRLPGETGLPRNYCGQYWSWGQHLLSTVNVIRQFYRCLDHFYMKADCWLKKNTTCFKTMVYQGIFKYTLVDKELNLCVVSRNSGLHSENELKWDS